MLVTGRGLNQFNAGTMTRRSVTQELHPTDLLDISLHDANELGVDDGSRVRITSRYGHAVLIAHVTDGVAPGVVFTTFSDPTLQVNRLTSSERDAVTHTPEYKFTAVRLEAVDGTPLA